MFLVFGALFAATSGMVLYEIVDGMMDSDDTPVTDTTGENTGTTEMPGSNGENTGGGENTGNTGGGENTGGGVEEQNFYNPENYSGEFTGTDEADDVDGTILSSNHAFFLEGGDDTLIGDAGNDYAEGGEGDDRIDLASGNDILLGEEGDDILNGNKGSDTLLGGIGNDTLIGHNFGDSLVGGEGNDVLYSDLTTVSPTAFDSVDTLLGGEGDDTLHFAGGDIASGGEGEDTFVMNDTTDANSVATIQDFELTEMIEIIYDDSDGAAAPTLAFAANEAGTDTVVTLDDEQTLLVSGVTGLTEANFTLVAASTLS